MARFAVDGITDSGYSETWGGTDQWWAVDLGNIYYIYKVKLWSRLGGYGELNSIMYFKHHNQGAD